jgi:hypothetical protein
MVIASVAPVGATTFPYDLDAGRETALTAAGAGLFALGYFHPNARTGLSEDRLARLDPAAVPGWDRIALGRWDESAALASDRLVTALLIAPAADRRGT